MVKCPFCGFGNEDGALFCEQCKSDVSNVAPAAASPPAAPPTPMPESIPPGQMMPEDETPVLAAIVEETPEAEVVPLAPAEETPAAELVEEVQVVGIEEAPPAAIVEEAPAAAIVEEAPPPVAEAPPAAAPAMEIPTAAVVAETPAAPTPPAEAPAPPPAATPAAAQTPIPAGAEIKLVVQRGLKIGEEFNLFPGENYVGRADEKPVDIDLTFQEPEDRVWCSRQHALLVYDDATGTLTVEDLNSSNGTYVNREKVYPGQPRQLFAGNTIQIGTVHMRVKV